MLYSNCCNAPDRIIRKVLDMHFSEQGVCPQCLEMCDYSDPDIIEELSQVTKGQNDLTSLAIKYAIKSEPHMTLFEYIKSQAKDNVRLMEDVIGIELTNKILAL